MLYQYIRVLKYNGTAFTDYSLINQDEANTISATLATSDYLYVGQYFPFNNLYFYMGVANTATSAMSVEFWDGSAWRSAVDILDATSVSGKTLAQSGVMQFAPNRDYGWMRIDDTSDNSAPTEMQAITIYDLYWLRIKVSALLTGSPTIKRIAYAFTSTQQLNNLDVEINGYYASFGTGKSDWIPEILTASTSLVMDLRRRGLVAHYGQILRLDDFSMACDYKTLHLIYSNLGKAYKEKADSALGEYNKLISVERLMIDQDNNAGVSDQEIAGRVKQLIR